MGLIKKLGMKMKTLPRLLQGDGYKTSLIGKYHLGELTTPAEGVHILLRVPTVIG